MRSWWQQADASPEATANQGGADHAGRFAPPSRTNGNHDGQTGEFRADLVARVRNAIAAGTYDTPEKWETALARLLQQVERA